MINECRNSFAFQLPCSEILQRRKNFNMKIMDCSDMLGYFGLHKLNWLIVWLISYYYDRLILIFMVYIGIVVLLLLYADVDVIYLFFS